jgi:hypothetical protein
MAQLTQLTSFRSLFGTRIMTMALGAFFLIIVQASPTLAQWGTSGTNIYNTNTGNVGVGTTTATPSERLTVVAQDAVSNGVTQVLSVAHTTTGTPAAGLGAGFTFRANRSDGSTGNIGYIAGVWEDPTNGTEDGALVFAPVLNSTGFGTERMRITSNGNVGIGTTNPGRPLQVTADASGYAMRIHRNASNVGWGTGIHWAFNNSAGNVTDYAYVNSSIVSNTAGAENGTLGFFTVKAGSLTQHAIIDQNGNVGIGTTTPAYKLDVIDNNANAGGFQLTNNTNGPTSQLQNRLVNNAGSLAYYGLTSTGYTQAPILSNRAFFGSYGVDTVVWTQSANNIIFATNGITTAAERMRIDSSGNVGIGMSPDAQYRLDVNGSVRVSGNIAAKYQDVAEWVPASRALPAGTVVTLDPTKSNHVEASSQAYDTRVAGVVSEQPGITLGESGENKVLVATTGRVRVTVDASRAPIHIGDLLVTSDMPGTAMKSEPITIGGRQIHSPGTLIGKALEPLEKGSGKILVLLSLQ